MAATAYGAHGHLFTVTATDQALEARVHRALATLAVTAPGVAGAYRITTRSDGLRALHFRDEEVSTRFTDDRILLLLHWDINQRVIESASARRTTFHAAAARSPRGTGVLLAAPMESGKTTTVAGLLRAGWDFLTDEAAACDPDGVVHAYAKPLTLDKGSWHLFPELRPVDAGHEADSWLVPASATGASVAPTAPLGLIVFPRYSAGQPTQSTPLSPSEAAWRLSQSAFGFDRHGRRDLRCVSSLARRVPAVHLDIGDLDAAVEIIRDIESSKDVAA